jgi:hypothetical protein
MSSIGFSDLQEVWGPTLQPSTKSRKKNRNSKRESKRAIATKSKISNDDDPIFGFYDRKFNNMGFEGQDYSYGSDDSYIKTKNVPKSNNSFEDDVNLLELDDLKENFKGNEAQIDEDILDTNPKTEIVKYVDFKNNRHENSTSKNNENHDVFLYVFSGVILLFILEQFIQVGLHLGIRNFRNDK